jgi:polyisoprenoid-binding protein YceI
MGVAQTRPRRWKRWALASIAAVAAVIVGGPFLYIHFIEGKAPAPFRLNIQPPVTTPAATAAAASPGATSSTSVDGNWSVAAASRAGYRVNEILFGQTNTAVGRTSSVTGTITISGTTVTAASFSVDMTSVKSDRSQRDNQFHGRIMDTASYPTATFTLSQPIRLSSVPAEGVTVTESASGNLNMHGATKAVTFAVTATRNASGIQVVGSIPITFATWNIPNPSFGPVSTDDHGILEVFLNLTHA